MKKLQGKVAIITGATSGMGAATARLFAEEGARVLLCSRNTEKGRTIEKDINSSSGEAYFVSADVATPEGNEKLVSKTMERFGRIDIIVLSAGMLGLGSITEVSSETWHQTIETNLSSVFYLLRHAIPEIKKTGGGSIVIIGSIASFKAFPNHAAYCASKGALVPLVKQIALDYAPNIRVNLISPGPVDTPLIWNSARAFPEPAVAVEAAGRSTLAGRLGQPEDIAKAALFLASDDASFITGTSLTVDGGILTK